MKVSKVGYGYKVVSGKHEMHVGNFGIVMSCTIGAETATYAKMRAAAIKFINKQA